MKIPIEQFLELIKRVASKDTSFKPDKWIPENPLSGHCAVVSLVAQDYYGGILLRASLEKIPEYAYARFHYWNKFPDGIEVDFTIEQFGGKLPDLTTTPHNRKRLLSIHHVKKRYDLLTSRFNELVR